MDDFFELYGSKPPHADDNQRTSRGTRRGWQRISKAVLYSP
jgi:hypothetical protein